MHFQTIKSSADMKLEGISIVGTDLREQFEEPYEANVRRSELEAADVVENLAVTVEEVEIPF